MDETVKNLRDDILTELERKGVPPDVALLSLQYAMASVLNFFGGGGAGERFIDAVMAFQEAEMKVMQH
jgi:hypothetical protein